MSVRYASPGHPCSVCRDFPPQVGRILRQLPDDVTPLDRAVVKSAPRRGHAPIAGAGALLHELRRWAA